MGGGEDRSEAAGDDPLRDRRSAAAGGHPGAGKMLDLLAVAPEERDFAALSHRIQAGRTLPAPKPVFPRWIEPEEKVS